MTNVLNTKNALSINKAPTAEELKKVEEAKLANKQAEEAAILAKQQEEEEAARLAKEEEEKKQKSKEVEDVRPTSQHPVSYDFRALRLNQIVLASGALFKPKDGIYSPKTEEQYNLLCYYESLDMGYVERVKL